MSGTTFIYRAMIPASLAWESRYYIVMRTKNSKSVKQMLNLWSLSWAKLAAWLKLPLPNKKMLLTFWNGPTVFTLRIGRVAGKKTPESGRLAVDFKLWCLKTPSWVWSLAMFVCLPQNLSQISPIFCSAEGAEWISCCTLSAVSVWRVLHPELFPALQSKILTMPGSCWLWHKQDGSGMGMSIIWMWCGLNKSLMLSLLIFNQSMCSSGRLDLSDSCQ